MNKIPPWVLRIALLVSLPIAGAALFLTRTYAVGNLSVLGLDAETVFVRRLSIDVLLAAHVAAFFLVALLPDSVFRFRRWQLYTLAIAIWAFDGAAIYQARFGVMDSADQAQVSAVTRLADQRAAIKELQDSAAALRATAARQLNNKMITAGAQSQKEAARLAAKAAAMSEQLAGMPTGAGTTEVRTWGALAPWKAATESALISFVSLIMLGLAGLMLRELLQPGLARRAAPALAPAAPTPAKRDAPAPVPKVSYGKALAGASLAGVGAAVAPVAHAAPAAPAAPAPTPAQVQKQAKQVQNAPEAVAPAPAEAENAPAEVQGASRRTVPEGLREAIKSGACKPSQGAVKKLVGGNWGTAARHLQQLGEEGILESAGNGRWKLKKEQA